MKTIAITQYKEGLDTLVLLKSCLNSSGPQGLTMPVVRARLKVFDAIERAEKDHLSANTLQLEDAEYETAKEAVKETRWVVVEPHLVKFADLFDA